MEWKKGDIAIDWRSDNLVQLIERDNVRWLVVVLGGESYGQIRWVMESDLRPKPTVREPIIGRPVPTVSVFKTIDDPGRYEAIRPDWPTVADTILGIAMWHAEDPANRRVVIDASGHTINLAFTTLDPIATRKMRFARPALANAALAWIEHVATLPPDGETFVVPGDIPTVENQ